MLKIPPKRHGHERGKDGWKAQRRKIAEGTGRTAAAAGASTEEHGGAPRPTSGEP